MHEPKTTQKRFFRRREAAEFLKEGWRFGSAATLAKLAVVGGGPEFRKANKIVLYEQGALESWANAKVGPPIRSTSELAS